MRLRSDLLRLLFPVLCLCAALLQAGCSAGDSPPYYTARITDVYQQQTTVERFSLLYWWQERGETPFLKTNSLAAKELIVEVMHPAENDPTRVTVKTERIAFAQLSEVAVELTEAGKQLLITTRDGRSITAGTAFPKSLKTGQATGLADAKIFAQGIVKDGGKASEFKLALDFIKKISIIERIDD